MASSAQVVYAGRAELAEGPVWFAGALWWVDIAAGTLNRLDPATGINSSRGWRWLLARQHDCSLLDWDKGRFTPLAAPLDGVSSRHRFNDGKCDAKGRFWIGTAHLDQKPNEASLFAVEPNGRVRRVLHPLSLSNGLGWSPDSSVFYHIDTPTRRIQRFAFDLEAGTMSNPQTLHALNDRDGWPDGMTVDAEGHLWVALWSGGAVMRISAQDGTIMERHALPVSNVSSCTFGGPDLRTLYITTAWEGFTPEQRQKEPLAGSIFALRTSVQGMPVVPFAIGSTNRR
jgi:sugar lactone lactonase YvrE